MNELKSLLEILATLSIIFANVTVGCKTIKEIRKSKRRRRKR